VAQASNPLLNLTNLQAESAVNGALLIDPDAILRVCDWLDADHFHDERQKWIYEAVRDLHEHQAHVDYMTVVSALSDAGHLREVGGAAYLTELINATPTAMHVSDYARTVYRLGVLRGLVQVAGQIAQVAYTAGGSELDDVIEKVQRLVDSATPMAGDDSLELWIESLDAFMENQIQRSAEETARQAGELPPHIDFPWKALQRFRGLRLRPGTVAIVAGGSGIGKTTFMECCADYWAKGGLRVAFFHLELSKQFMRDRRSVRLSGESLDSVEGGLMSSSIQRADDTFRRYAGDINYVHCPGWSARRIANKARQMHAKGLIDVVIVDYLQKMEREQRRGWNTNDALADCVEVFKVLTEQLDISLLLGSQLNRQSEYAGRKTGVHIRGTGEAHEKANIVLTLDREILESPITDSDGTETAHRGQRSPQMFVRVDKNTYGEMGDTELVMNGARYVITDVWHEAARAA
jgi:replicative DNA helicase